MKYWKGKAGTPKEGMYGTMDDTGKVPDSEPATKAECDAYTTMQPAAINKKAEYAALTTDSQRIAKIAEYLGLISK